MTPEQQRAIVAEGIMNWEYHETSRFSPYPHYADSIRLVVHVADYHPDLKDDRSLGQMRDLKARLEKLRVGYESGWDAGEGAWALLKPWRLGVQNIAVSGSTSEGAALLEAAARLAKEMKCEVSPKKK